MKEEDKSVASDTEEKEQENNGGAENNKSKKDNKKDKKKEPVSEEKIKEYSAKNRRASLWTALLITMLAIAVVCFFYDLIVPGFVLAGVGAVCIVPIMLSPLRYIFTKKDVTIVYCFGVKERVEWYEVKRIALVGKHYKLQYKPKRKYPFFVSGEIIKTRKTKKYLNKLYKKEIV